MNCNNNLVIDMLEEGVSGAVGRVLGMQVKDKIIYEFKANSYKKIILDFSKVDFITSGFAKELFGGLHDIFLDSFKEVVTVRISKENETLKNTIIRALATAVNPQ